MEGKYNSISFVDDNLAVIISASNCQHTGSCKAFTQQQIIQCAHKCEYIKWISDVALFTLCSIDKEKMSLNSYYVAFMGRLQMANNDQIIPNYQP